MTINATATFNGDSVAARAEYFCGPERDDQEGAGPGREDYYIGAVDDRGGSAWIGQGAEHLGLTGKPVTTSDFADVFGGIDPTTGERFIKNKSKPQLDKKPFGDDERAGIEIALNVDKSISALYAIADIDLKQQLEKAMFEANDAMFNHMVKEGYFKARTGKAGEGVKISIPGVIAARFLHCTNRNQDTHLHIHLEISSVVFDETGKARKLDPLEVVKRQKEIGYLYDVFLTEELNKLGISLSENEHGVKAAGFDEDFLNDFSSRRLEIMAKRKAVGATGKGTRELSNQIALGTRKEKDNALNQADLFEEWKARAREFGYSEAYIAEQAALGHEFREQIKTDELESLLLNGRSTFTGYDLDRVATRFAIGRGGIDAIAQVRSDMIERCDLIRLPNAEYTTRQVFESEKAVLKSAMGRAGEATHTIAESKVTAIVQAIRAEAKRREIEAGRDPEAVNGLNPEQENALYYLTSRSGGIAVLEGAAGTGKSFTMKAVKRAFEGDGFNIMGLAPSGKAAEELESGSEIKSSTIHSLLLRLENGKADLSSNDVLVLDEAGMADSVTLARLADYAHEAGAKLILTGDSEQLDAVGTASLLRSVGDEIGRANLVRIARQKDETRRSVSENFFARGYRHDENGKQIGIKLEAVAAKEAISTMVNEGLIAKGKTPDEVLEIAVEKYLVNSAARGFSESLLLADSNAEVTELNDRIRQRLVEDGKLDATKAVAVTFEDDRGKERREQIMPGDRVMCRKNNKDLGVSNGSLATVESIDQNGNLAIRLDGTDEHVNIDLNEYRNLDLAYAMTVHKSQGMNVDRCVYMVTERSNNRSMYVAYTRSREGGEFVTAESYDDVIKLAEKTGAKQTSLDAYKEVTRKRGAKELTVTNPLIDGLRKTAAASQAAAAKENDKDDDLAVTTRILSDEFRYGVAGDLDKDTWHGNDVALTDDDRQVIEHWKDKEAERMRQAEREQETATTEREPGELCGTDQGEDFNPAEWQDAPDIEDSEAEQAEQAESAADHETSADKAKDDDNYLPPPPPPPPPEPENEDDGMSMG